VLLLVVRQGLGASLLGLVIGLAGALAGGRLLAAFLYGVSPSDEGTFAVVTLGLLLVVVLACLIPAGRATRVDPIQSLRAE
jgi:ABC-type antimicrobial peptide transport system permease subunit